MPKRKGTPKRADKTKRQLISWNLDDLGRDGIQVVVDHNPSLAAEMVAKTSREKSSAPPPLDEEELLSECQFYLSIHHSHNDESLDWRCLIGCFALRVPSENIQSTTTAFNKQVPLYLYANQVKNLYYLYHEEVDLETASGSSVKKRTFYYKVETDVPFTCLEALQMKCFQLRIMEFDVVLKTLKIGIYGTKNVLTELKFSSEGWTASRKNRALQTLMENFYSLSTTEYSGSKLVKKHDIQALYEMFKRYHVDNPTCVRVDAQHPSLRPVLRDYQKRAVLWMLAKEGVGEGNDTNAQGLHPLYDRVTMKDGKELFYSKESGYLVSDEPLTVAAPPGGILGDEMGLGKTVEVLSCILCHPRSKTNIAEVSEVEDDETNEDVEVSPSEAEVNFEKQVERKSCDGVELDGSPANNAEVASNDPFQHYADTINAVTKENTETQNEEPEKLKDVTEVTLIKKDELRTAPLLESLVDKCMNERAALENQRQEKVVDPENIPVMKQEHNYSNGKITSNDPFQHYVDTIDAVTKENTETQTEEAEKPKDDFEANEPHVECVCGNIRNLKSDDTKIKCATCGSWQHPKCMNLDEEAEHRQSYLCPHCLAASPPIPSGATLIVSPKTICHQWVEEIEKHVRNKSLKVLVYAGVTKQGFVQPQTLADQDIVITTYETLGREINYVDLPHTASETGRRFRKPKRFLATPSPITAVEWWRICLDEAQMVECTTTKTADMALRLKAVNRWCVTGTPIQRSLEDLYGLLLFLGVEPVWVKHWWKKLLYEPYCYGNQQPLVETVGRVLWRTCKKDVIEQIGLPLQTEEVHLLTFSPVEEHFYRRQYEKCAGEALAKLGKFDDVELKLSSLDRHTLHQLLYPLLRLRQACCHPQVVKGEFVPLHKSTMSMEELLNQLIKKTRLEGEEAHRQSIAAVNGLAALCIIEENLPGAVEHYRTALRTIEEHREKLRTDDLQELHTVHNLNEVLAQKPSGVDPTLRDDQLSAQAEDLKAKYLAKAAVAVSQAHEAWRPTGEALAELQDEWRGDETWWCEMLKWVMSQGLDQMLLERVCDDMINFREIRTLEFVIVRHLDALEKVHSDLVKHLDDLKQPPTRELINKTVECCLRPANPERIDKECPFCIVDDMFQSYESKLYSFDEKKSVSKPVNNDSATSNNADNTKYLLGNRRQGTWADSQVERILKSMIAFGRGFNDSKQWTECGNQHIKILEALKKEFRALRAVWMALREQVSAFDEIDMATLRFRLRYLDEPQSEIPQPHIIERVELGQQKLKLMSDRVIGDNDTQRKLGQHLYLKNLAKAQTGLEGGSNPEVCPICQGELGTQWSVLQCGHCYCLECIKVLVTRSNLGGRGARLKCPVCRQMASLANISYVSTTRDEDRELMHVKGDHSTKVAGVVQCLKEILKKDPLAKALVFSTWQEVLVVVSQALMDNDITCRLLQAQNRFQNNLKAFREREDVSVLLLPVHSGANGLNLIEATHVLLVEPILNPAQELQAVGRIHRIGQTKSTVVHRFLVRGTIEEPVSSLLKANPQSSEGNLKSEETPFTIGDLKSLFQNTQ